MNRLLLYSAITVLTLATTTTGFAKEKKKDKHKDKHKKHTTHVEESNHYYVGHDGQRHWNNESSDYRGYNQPSRGYGYGDDHYGHGGDHTRTIYVIERDRPVQRVVYMDGDGRYYRWEDGRRFYVTGHYYESYPSRYYYSDGRPRVGISVRF